MKKNYIQPLVKEHKLQMRPYMDIISPTDNSLGDDAANDITDSDIGAHSIWDDTCGDGFNW